MVARPPDARRRRGARGGPVLVRQARPHRVGRDGERVRVLAAVRRAAHARVARARAPRPLAPLDHHVGAAQRELGRAARRARRAPAALRAGARAPDQGARPDAARRLQRRVGAHGLGHLVDPRLHAVGRRHPRALRDTRGRRGAAVRRRAGRTTHAARRRRARGGPRPAGHAHRVRRRELRGRARRRVGVLRGERRRGLRPACGRAARRRARVPHAHRVLLDAAHRHRAGDQRPAACRPHAQRAVWTCPEVGCATSVVVRTLAA